MAIDSSRSRSGPRRPRRSPTTEVRSELDGFVLRLRRCGATDDEVAATVRSWDDFDDGWTLAQRYDMVRWSDDRIEAELAALRDEYERHTT